MAFAEQFETRAKGLFDAANAAVDEFSTCRPEYASAVVDGLVCVDVEEFCEYCRNCSQRLRKRLRDGDNSPDGPGNGGSKASKPKVKKGPGRPAKSDPKADKRIWDAWKTRAYNNYRELANELGREVKEVGLAIDRQRKREATETAFPDSRSGSSGGWNPED